MKINIHQLNVSNSFFKNNCYLIVDTFTKKALIIDPAWQIEIIERAIREYDASLFAVLLTHSHIDHVNLADTLAKKYHSTVLMSKVEIDYYGFSCANLLAIQDLKTFSFCDREVLPILTPGHTKGSLCYLIGENLFTGDTLFCEGCGICWGKGADPNDMFESLSLLKQLTPQQTRIYPGHSYSDAPGQTFEYLLKNNIYLNLNDRKQFVTFRMRGNQTNLFSFTKN